MFVTCDILHVTLLSNSSDNERVTKELVTQGTQLGTQTHRQ